MSRLLGESPDQLVDRMTVEGDRRVWVVRDADSGRYRASHASFTDIARFLDTDCPDVSDHEAIFLEANAESGTLFAAFLHRTTRGQGQGGLRHWPYEKLVDLLRDGLSLSLCMSR